MFAPVVDPVLVSVSFNDGKFCSFAWLLVFVDEADGEAMLRSAITQTEWLLFLSTVEVEAIEETTNFFWQTWKKNMISGFIDLGM